MLIALVLYPGVRMLGPALAWATVAEANRCAGRTLLTLRRFTPDGRPVQCDDGTVLAPDETGWTTLGGADLILLLAQTAKGAPCPLGLRGALCRADKAGATLGGIGNGGLILAGLGLLDGHEAALVPDDAQAFARRHPDIRLSGARHRLDRRRLTAPGALATSEALTAWLSRAVSPALAAQTAQALWQGQARPLAPDPAEDGADPLLARMQALMSAHLEHPLGVETLADALALSPKRLRSRCQAALGETPNRVYLGLRLERAHALVTGTGLPVEAVARACGFASASAFTRSFRERFGHSPRSLRSASRRSGQAARRAVPDPSAQQADAPSPVPGE